MLVRRVVGFDANEDLTYRAEFPEAAVPDLTEYLDVEDDWDLVDDYALTGEALSFVERVLGIQLDRSLEYFFQSSERAG